MGVLTAFLAVTGSVGALASSHQGSASARRAIPGGALPQVASATAVAPTPDAKKLDAVVFLAPRDPAGLEAAATAASAGRPLSLDELRSRFLPTAAQVERVERYLKSQGLRIAHRSLLSLSVTGSAAAQERAFGFQLRLYRGTNGKLFRAPSGTPRLPLTVAGLVQAVGGLDSSMMLTRATSRAVQPAAVATPSCSGAINAHAANSGSLMPAQLGGTGGYNHNALINAGNDGSNESIAFVEFSNYSTDDVARYRSCFGITSPAPVNKPVAGGTANRSGAGEVELDVETAISNAPGARTYVYMAPNNIARSVDIIDRIVADQASTGVRIVSDSWGLCEPVMPASIAAAENSSLQLAAAAGISFFVATGDDGSSGCVRSTGSAQIAAVDPATQPFATAVGGTRLKVSPYNEVTWRGGGGGASMLFPKPTWQLGKTIGIPNGGARCGNGSGQCRQIPDVSLNASPNTPYIMYCTVSATACVGLTGWVPVAGTSASAPLMAAITADANEYSLGHGGPRLGYANPFLYASSTVASGMYHDITSGGNNIAGGKDYNALPGYDMATGWGSVNAMKMATQLAGGTPVNTPADATQITLATPLNAKTFRYGSKITFSGTLRDTTTATPINHGLIAVETASRDIRVVSNADRPLVGDRDHRGQAEHRVASDLPGLRPAQTRGVGGAPPVHHTQAFAQREPAQLGWRLSGPCGSRVYRQRLLHTQHVAGDRGDPGPSGLRRLVPHHRAQAGGHRRQVQRGDPPRRGHLQAALVLRGAAPPSGGALPPPPPTRSASTSE